MTLLHGEELKVACETALYKAEELLKIGWTNTWAKNSKGQSCDPQDEDACEWCLEGALMAVTYHVHPDYEERQQVIQQCMILTQTANKEFHIKAIKNSKHPNTASRIAPSSVIPSMNDASSTTKEQVVGWVKMARRLANLAKWGKPNA